MSLVEPQIKTELIPGYKPGYKTTEFGVTVATVATSVIAVAGVLFGVPAETQQSLGAGIERATVVLAALVADAVIVWRYISGRVEVKKAGPNKVMLPGLDKVTPPDPAANI